MTVTTLVDLPFNDDSQQVLTVLSITFTIYTRTSFGLNSAGILATSLFVTKIQRYAQFHFLKIPNFSKKILNCSCRTKHVNNYIYIYGDSFCTLYIVHLPCWYFLKIAHFQITILLPKCPVPIPCYCAHVNTSLYSTYMGDSFCTLYNVLVVFVILYSFVFVCVDGRT